MLSTWRALRSQRQPSRFVWSFAKTQASIDDEAADDRGPQGWRTRAQGSGRSPRPVPGGLEPYGGHRGVRAGV